MGFIFRHLGRYKRYVALAIFIKLIGTLSELALPYILEHIIDNVVPTGDLVRVLAWGAGMFGAAIFCRAFNVMANARAIENAHKISFGIRQELFEKTINLTGREFDSFGLPSLISRMTSDSYNVQSAVQQLQTLCVRAPMMLVGGVLVSLFMDRHLAMVLVVMLPVLLAIVFFVASRGIPMYTVLQEKLDTVVRMMRENITGIRVVKALSKEDYEKKRFASANADMARQDIAAATVMAVPGPLMQLFLNCALTAIVLLGASRVNAGLMRPGVILALLTYVNMIAMGVMGVTRIFMTMSRASASANRIAGVMASVAAENENHIDSHTEEAGREANLSEECAADAGEKSAMLPPVIEFDHVSFSYTSDTGEMSGFAGEEREKALEDISFAIRKGESLGIIGPTGCGKTTVVNLMMRFYDVEEGRVLVDGRDVRSYDRDTLRRKFGAAFQNDIIFQDTLRENIDFGRNLPEEALKRAAEDAMAGEFIAGLAEGLDFQADIRGANLSGGQKQRILVARALAASPEILILDDSSSALDYKTDAQMRQAIAGNHPDSTVVMIAQRISSIMNMTHILVLDDGKCIGYGSHEELLASCAPYREIYEVQMGAMTA